MSQPLTEERQCVFLDHLAETANVSLSAKRAGVSRSAVYRLRATDPVFSHGWRMAIDTCYDELEFMMLKRARFGIIKPFKRGDGTMGRVTEYDDAHGLRLLTAYKARSDSGASNVPGDATVATAARNQLSAKLEGIRQRLDAAPADTVGAQASPQ